MKPTVGRWIEGKNNAQRVGQFVMKSTMEHIEARIERDVTMGHH